MWEEEPVTTDVEDWLATTNNQNDNSHINDSSSTTTTTTADTNTTNNKYKHNIIILSLRTILDICIKGLMESEKPCG